METQLVTVKATLSTEKEWGGRNGAWLKQAFVHKLTSAIRKMYTVPPCVFKIWNSFLTASRCCLALGFALQSESGLAMLWSSGAAEVHSVLCGWRPSPYHMAAVQRRGLAFPGIWWTVCWFGRRANSCHWLSQGGWRDTFWFCFPVYMVCTDGEVGGGRERGAVLNAEEWDNLTLGLEHLLCSFYSPPPASGRRMQAVRELRGGIQGVKDSCQHL